MVWEELLLDRRVADSTLIDALATTFAVPAGSVRVIDSVLTVKGRLGDEIRLLVERRLTRGDFPLQVRVYIRDAELEQHVRPPDVSAALVQRFCGLAGAGCLMSDDSPSGVSWLLVGRSVPPVPVTLDADRLEDDEYVIVAEKAARAS